jgi:hypothetical protein
MGAEIANVLRKRATAASDSQPQKKSGFISSFASMLSGAAATITGQSDEGMYLRKYR